MGTRQWHPYYVKAQAKMERAITVAASKIFTLNSFYPTNETEPRRFKEAKMWLSDTYVNLEPSQCNRNKASSGIYTNNCIFLILKFEGNHNCMFPSQQ